MRLVINKYSTHFIGCGINAGYWLFGKQKFDKDGIVILNGIDLESYKYDCSKRKEIRKNYNLKDSFVVGHAGHFADVKNQKYIVELMPQLINQKSDVMLLLLGDGETKNEIKDLAKALNVEECIVFTGNVNNVGDYLSAMDVFAFPSKYEGVPLSLIEAQTNGLPCIVSDKIPEDVYLTDLIKPVAIDKENKTEWIDNIISSKRNNPEHYFGILKNTDFNTDVMLNKIYTVYEEGN